MIKGRISFIRSDASLTHPGIRTVGQGIAGRSGHGMSGRSGHGTSGQGMAGRPTLTTNWASSQVASIPARTPPAASPVSLTTYSRGWACIHAIRLAAFDPGSGVKSTPPSPNKAAAPASSQLPAYQVTRRGEPPRPKRRPTAPIPSGASSSPGTSWTRLSLVFLPATSSPSRRQTIRRLNPESSISTTWEWPSCSNVQSWGRAISSPPAVRRRPCRSGVRPLRRCR